MRAPTASNRCQRPVLSEILTQPCEKELTAILRELYSGGHPEVAISQFELECESLDEETLSNIVSGLEKEGLQVHSNPRAADFYHEVLTEKLAAGKLRRFAPGHPVRVYMEENRLLNRLLDAIDQLDPIIEREKFESLFQQIAQVELHYVRKENQLFPCLERHGWDSPSKNMWAFHDDIRTRFKQLRQLLEAGDLRQVGRLIPFLLDDMRRMINIEEVRLLPNALELLDESEWQAMRPGDQEIGWMLEQAPPPYPAPSEDETGYVHPSQVEPSDEMPFATDNRFHYDEGYMTPEQVNLIFRHLPVDITYVDENDRVVFYNRGEDRLFPRSAGIIGREVRYCHPPKSVDTVLRIVEAFRNNEKDVADFHIHVKGRLVQIRYFAVRDENRNYWGVIEMSQDVTDIKTLKGEQRLLDWD